jgi:ZIP family zinc transporter
MVLLLALLPGAGNFLGGVAAEIRQPSARFLNWALHSAAGIVIAIVTIELMPKAVSTLAGWWIALAFAAGGGAYLMLESFVHHLQGDAQHDRMWMIYATVAVDLTSDGFMLGSGSAVSSSLAIVLAAGQVLADVPEGYATVANFRDKNVPRGRRMLLAASFFLYVVGAATLSYFLLRGAPQPLKLGALVFVAGLLTVAAIEDMLEEAHATSTDSRWSVFAFIGGFTLFTLVSTGLQAIVPP